MPFPSLLALLCLAGEPADLVLVAGRIATLDPGRPEARALAVRGDRIVAVGSEEEIAAWIGPSTRELRLPEAFAMPGFIESHGHFLGVGDARAQLDLRAAGSWEDIVAQVAAAVERARPGELIRGRGWHQEKWSRPPADAVQGLPRHDALSAVSPENPVILTHASGHAVFANAAAMELASISARTPDPEGGEVVRDERGRPIGAFRETAAGLLQSATARASRPSAEHLARLAVAECLEKGVTSFQDAGARLEDVALYRRMVDEGTLGVRLWVMLREPSERLAERAAAARVVGYGDRRLTVRAFKCSIDGALGSHGAWLLEPYADLPGSRGLETTPVAEVEALARLARALDYQLCVHAIGDRANREVLDVYERACEGLERPTSLRWRIEHAQHLHPDDVPRFAALGVIASMQGVHCTSDGPWVPLRLGAERARTGAYLWRSLLDSGARIANGTDAPVEDVDPIASFHASVTRRTQSGATFYPEQRMTRQEALVSYTLDAAHAAFEEGEKGSLEVGKLADVVVLSRDLLACPDEEIPGARVLATICGGKVAYRAP